MNTLDQNALLVDNLNASQRLLNQAQRQEVTAVQPVSPSSQVNLSSAAMDEEGAGRKVADKYQQTIGDFPGIDPKALPNKVDIALFEENFSRELDKAGVDTRIEIKLKVDFEGNIKVTNDHPDKERIEKIFSDNPDMQQEFMKANMAKIFENMYVLHQQWQQRIDSGASEEAAGLWLVQAAQEMVGNSDKMTFRDGKIADGSGNNNAVMKTLANLQAAVRM